jgi:hypothetical protein
MQKEQEFSGWDDKGYSMVQGHVEFTTTSMPGVWSSTVPLSSDVCLSYHYKRKLSEFEESSRKLYDLLFAMSSVMGVWDQDEDEDLWGSDGDNG